jgi:hypothetical protein
MGTSDRSRSLRRKSTAIGAALLIGGLTGVGPATEAGAVPSPVVGSTYTWSGAAPKADSGWSTSDNWQGDPTPPTSSSTDKLIFPLLECVKKTTCYDSNNDVTGLTVTSLSMMLQGETSNNGFKKEYNLTGNGITLDGLSTRFKKPSQKQLGQFGAITTPITLGKAQTWSIGLLGGSNFYLGPISGDDSLTVTSPINDSEGFIEFEDDVEVGRLAFQGSTGGSNVIVPEVAVNGTDGKSVAFTDSSLFSDPYNASSSITYGPLTVTGSAFQLGDGGGFGPYGLNSVDGSASFDSASSITYFSLEPGSPATTDPTPGTDYPQLSASGRVTLNSPSLSLNAGCDQTIGTTYTIVQATGGVIGTFAGIPDGTILQANADQEASCTATGATAPYVEIDYQSDAVTATVVAVPDSQNRTGSHQAVTSERTAWVSSDGRNYGASI